MQRVLVIGLGWLVVGCSSGPRMDVNYFWYPGASPYGLDHSYAWLDGEDEKGYNADYQTLVREHVDCIMQCKGFNLAEAEEADFWVRHYFGRQTQSAETGLQSYDEAVLIIDFIDKSSGAQLWRGRLLTRIEYELPPAERRERLKIGVQKMFKELPGPRN